MTRPRWMALCFALGSTCFLIGPFPGFAQLVGESADAITFFVGSILSRPGEAYRAGWPGPNGTLPVAEGRRGGPPSSSPPARCSSTSRRTRRCTPLWRAPSTTGLSGGPIGAAQSASSSPARLPTAPRRVMDGCRCAAARLRLLRNLGCRRLRRSVDRVDARSGGRQLEHLAGRRVLPGLCSRHPAHGQSLENASRSPAP